MKTISRAFERNGGGAPGAHFMQLRKETHFLCMFTSVDHVFTYMLVLQCSTELCMNHLNHPEAREHASITQTASVTRAVSSVVEGKMGQGDPPGAPPPFGRKWREIVFNA